jgi:hypothetical protein
VAALRELPRRLAAGESSTDDPYRFSHSDIPRQSHRDAAETPHSIAVQCSLFLRRLTIAKRQKLSRNANCRRPCVWERTRKSWPAAHGFGQRVPNGSDTVTAFPQRAMNSLIGNDACLTIVARNARSSALRASARAYTRQRR